MALIAAVTTHDRPSADGVSLAEYAVTAVFGGALGLLSAWFELAALPRYGRLLSPLLVLTLRTTFYVGAAFLVGVAVVGWQASGVLGLGLVEAYRAPSVRAFLGGPDFAEVLALVSVAAFVVNFVRQIRLVLGPGTLWALLVGRYRVPVEEERAFLFLDLTGSTATAQRLGPARFNAFKNDFFRDIAGPILATRGQIYQYVGDEVVVTWRVKDGRLRRSPVETFARLDAAIAARTDRYMARYGEVPTYKAGLHCGSVVTAEVGELKKDIVYSGDAVNVAARIEGQCHPLASRLLVSEAALELAPLPDGLTAESVGEINLRGRTGAVRLFRIRPPSTEEGRASGAGAA